MQKDTSFKKYRNPLNFIKKWWFPISGFIAFIWFLVRVIPKPSRATYPCQRAAFPMATSFIIWIMGIFGGTFALNKAKKKFKRFSIAIGTLSMVIIVFVIIGMNLQLSPPVLTGATVKLSPSDVSIVQSSKANAEDIEYNEIKSMVSEAIHLSGSLSGIVENNDTVVIKPNLVSNTPNGSTTDWRVTKAVTELVREINPDGTIYIMEGSASPTQQVFQSLGYTASNIPEADYILPLEEDSGEWQDINSPNLLKISLPDGLLHQEYYVNKKMKEADAFINISCLKNHESAGITGSCKNIGIGATPANIYGQSAYNPYRGSMVVHDNTAGDLHKWISDFYRCCPADFSIIDGLQGMQNGPISTDKDNMNMRLILASKDSVALDTVCGLVMNWDPESIGYLAYLNNNSIGNLDTSCINVLGKRVSDVRKSFDGRLPVGGGSKITDNTPPSLTVNSASLKGNTLNISINTGSDTVKAEVYVDGVFQDPAITSNYNNISINSSNISENSNISVYVYDRFLNNSERKINLGGTTNTTEPTTSGDVNNDGNVNIVDALLVAQYYVGDIPDNFNNANADVNNDGNINMIDSLLIAQYYVGLISSFE